MSRRRGGGSVGGGGQDDGDFDDNQSVSSEISALSHAFSHSGVSDVGSVYGLDNDDEGGYADIELPEYACSYCGLSDPACVVRCTDSGKWFCNGRGNTSSSHIIHHLVRSKNKKVSLHPDSPLGDSVLECYCCGTKNVFLLGFISAKADSVVVLLCREPCLANGALKDMGWDLTQWEPLIEDKAFLSWLVRMPTEKEQLRARQITTAQINKLEDLWKENPDATQFDLDRPGPDDEYVTILPDMRYDDGYNYQNIVAPLVQLEADEDKRSKEEQKQEDLSVVWESGVGRSKIALLTFSGLEEMRVVPGDEIVLRLDAQATRLHGAKWEGRGTVQRISDGTIEMLMRSVDIPTQQMKGEKIPITEGYSAEFVWKNAVYDRMHRALKAFAIDDTSVSGYLYHRILGHVVEVQSNKCTIPDRLSVPGLVELNPSQNHAVREVLRRPLSLIQGPPGTGKTTTSASIVYHFVQQSNGQVLVCSPANVAVDHLTEKIHKCGLRVVRLCALTRETLPSSVEHLSLHSMVRNLDTPEWAELRKYQLLKEAIGELKAADAAKLRQLVAKAEKQILEAADVICCTCVGAGDQRLTNLRFRTVLIDESTHATEAECLIPIVMGCKQLVLVGDHCQLGPVVMSKSAGKHGLSLTLFERLVNLGTKPLRLEYQYRMHPALSEWPSNMFYEGALQNGVTDRERSTAHLNLPWSVPERPMLFIHCNGKEEMGSNGSSYLNREEARQIEKIVSEFLLPPRNVQPEQIGIICAYEAQRAYLTNYLENNGSFSDRSVYSRVEVASVDAFQGREKEFMILSCVRSNEMQGIGFLRDPRRLNVAITRASHGLIIIGNAKLLAKDPLWNNLLTHFQARDCLVEGSEGLKGLRHSQLHIPQPKNAPYHQRFRITALGQPNFDYEGGGGGGGGDYYGNSWGSYADYDNPLRMDRAPTRAGRGLDSRYDPRYSDTASQDGSYYSQSMASTSNNSRATSSAAHTIGYTEEKGPSPKGKAASGRGRRGKGDASDTASVASQDASSVSSYSVSSTFI